MKELLQKLKMRRVGLFEATNTWGVFATKGNEATQIKDLVSGGEQQFWI